MHLHPSREAAQTAARFDPDLRRAYQRLKFRRASGVAKVAITRRLAVRLYGMLRQQSDYAQQVRMSKPTPFETPLQTKVFIPTLKMLSSVRRGCLECGFDSEVALCHVKPRPPRVT